MTDAFFPGRALRAALIALAFAAGTAHLHAQSPASRRADAIAAVVNQELVTNVEVDQRVARAKAEAARVGARLPNDDTLRREALNFLIDERVVLTHARDIGMKVDDLDVDRALGSIAAQNQLTVPQLRERLQREGMDYTRFRQTIRDQILVERVREREVVQRIRATDTEVDAMVEQLKGDAAADTELNIAQVLVGVPDGASDAVIAERRTRAEQALVRARAGEDFAALAREFSDDPSREQGGVLGMRPASRLPDAFVDAVKPLAPGAVAPALLRTGAGFHVLKLMERRAAAALRITQTRARHILLRPAAGATPDAAVQRLQTLRQQIAAGQRRFEDVAREVSEDGSAAQGGDLGWTSPGAFVPEFEDAMNRLAPGGISAPVQSRFGVHLIQVVERRDAEVDARQLRAQATEAVRERKFEQAYLDWVRDLRSQAYIEIRDGGS